MKRTSWMMIAVLVCSSFAAAQDQPETIEALNRRYQDALTQLKAAQDRKNELATENEKLLARVAELEQEIAQLKRDAAGFAQRSFWLRSHHAAWEAFMHRYPRLMAQWKAFLEQDILAEPANLPEILDPTETIVP